MESLQTQINDLVSESKLVEQQLANQVQNIFLLVVSIFALLLNTISFINIGV